MWQIICINMIITNVILRICKFKMNIIDVLIDSYWIKNIKIICDRYLKKKFQIYFVSYYMQKVNIKISRIDEFMVWLIILYTIK